MCSSIENACLPQFEFLRPILTEPHGVVSYRYNRCDNQTDRWSTSQTNWHCELPSDRVFKHAIKIIQLEKKTKWDFQEVTCISHVLLIIVCLNIHNHKLLFETKVPLISHIKLVMNPAWRVSTAQVRFSVQLTSLWVCQGQPPCPQHPLFYPCIILCPSERAPNGQPLASNRCSSAFFKKDNQLFFWEKLSR